MSDISNSNAPVMAAVPIEAPLSMIELATVLIKHYGLHEGTFDVLIEFQIGVGAVGPTPETLNPGAMISVSRVGLMPTTVIRPTTVDAKVVNPKKAAKGDVLRATPIAVRPPKNKSVASIKPAPKSRLPKKT